MAYISFSFINTEPDQTVQVIDQLDNSRNPIFNAPLNNGDNSGPVQCWAGGNGKGRVQVVGTVSAALLKDIDSDGFAFDY